MSRIYETAKKMVSEYLKESKANQEKKDFNIAINGMMKVAFSKNTNEAIKRKQKFNELFDSEIAKRGLDAQIEAIDCEEYFSKQNKTTNYEVKK